MEKKKGSSDGFSNQVFWEIYCTYFSTFLQEGSCKDPLGSVVPLHGSVVFRWPRITEEAQEVVVRPPASKQL